MPKYMNELRLHWFENNKKHFWILSVWFFAFWFSRSACTRKSVCWISKSPCWKYAQRNIYIIDRLANCLMGVSKWSKKHTASISATLWPLSVLQKLVEWYCLASRIIKQFECNPQRDYTCNLHKYAKREIQTVCVASINSTTISTKRDQAKSNGLALEVDLNWTRKIFAFAFCITKKFIIWTQPVTFPICNLWLELLFSCCCPWLEILQSSAVIVRPFLWCCKSIFYFKYFL